MTRLRNVVQGIRDGFYLKAEEICQDIAFNRLTHRDPGSLAWALDNVRLAWADVLVVLSGWAQ